MWTLFFLACSLGGTPTHAGGGASGSGPAGLTNVAASPTDAPLASDAAALAALPVIDGGRYVLGARAAHGHLAVWPVIDTRPPAVGDYVTLADGLAAKSVTVSEKDGGTVPTLFVENKGDTPVFLAAGDVVTGGRQDRVVVADTVVAAGSSAEVAVNCVEHGRWSGGGNFGYGGKAEYGLKETVEVAKDQGQTWEKVATLNAAKQTGLRTRGVDEDELAPSTGTYRASLDADGVRESAQPYEVAVRGALTGERVVGLVVAVNGEVVGAELFGSPALLTRSRDAIASSVARDALSRTETSLAAPADAVALGFLADTVSAKPSAAVAAPVGTRVETSGASTKGYDLREADGDLLHKSSYRK